ncbi:MAG: preprotein translocase subunit YajC [Gemmiger sp.]
MIQFLSTETSSTASLLMTFLPMILIIVFMYLILWLPQRKQDKKDAAMRASIEVGDTVVTIGGVVGRVAAINEKDDTFILETTSDRVKIRFRRSAISSVEKLDMGNGKDDSKKNAPAKKN